MGKKVCVEINGVFYKSVNSAKTILKQTPQTIKARCLLDDYQNYKIVPFRVTYTEKKCNICGKIKLLSEFYKNKKNRDRRQSKCKKCSLLYDKDYYIEHKEEMGECSKQYCQNNKESVLKYRKQYYQNNKEKALDYQEEWRKDNTEYQKEYRKNNRKIISEKQRKKIQKDPILKLNRNIRNAIGRSLKGMKNGEPWETLVGYTLKEFITHFENLFTKDMNWDNYGKGKYEWCIDHIIPIKEWDITSNTCQELKACWALKNLQPLWWIRNIEKGDRPMEPKYLIKPGCIK